jgi:hypothetical protein
LRAHKKFHFLVPIFSVLSFRPLSTPCATMGLRFGCAAASRVSTAVAAAEAVSDVVSGFAWAAASPTVMHAQVALSNARRPRSVGDTRCTTRGSARHRQLEPPQSKPTHTGRRNINAASTEFRDAASTLFAPRSVDCGAFFCYCCYRPSQQAVKPNFCCSTSAAGAIAGTKATPSLATVSLLYSRLQLLWKPSL